MSGFGDKGLSHSLGFRIGALGYEHRCDSKSNVLRQEALSGRVPNILCPELLVEKLCFAVCRHKNQNCALSRHNT